MRSYQGRSNQNSGNSSDLLFDAQRIFRSAIEAVSPFKLSQVIQEISVADSCRVVGAGKAAMAMASTLEQSYPDHSFSGQVVVPHGYIDSFPADLPPPRNIIVREGGHPIPDADSLHSARDALKIAESLGDQDTLIVLLSGGASALWSLPIAGLTLMDLQKVNQQLLECGAEIHQINTIRKHLSQIKGGQLAKAASPAQLITLAISDVIDDDESVIGSGPTVGDPTTWEDVVDIIDYFDIEVPPAVWKFIDQGIDGQYPETPESISSVFQHASYHLLASNNDAIEGAKQMAEQLGYNVVERNLFVSGEARDIGAVMAQRVRLLQPRECLLWGGETTVTIQGMGKGGRNQELVLSAACEFKRSKANILLLSGGTDGIDGPTDAAGGWSTPNTFHEAKSKGIDLYEFLSDNDAYHCLQEIDQLLFTGPTHTNVMDIGIGLRGHE